MNTLADELVSIQTGSRVCPLDALVVWRSCSDRRVSTALRRVLTKSCERVRGCRADCSRQYEVIDFLAVQIALRASSANADFQLSTRDCGPSWGHHNIRGKTHAKDAIRRANALLTTLSHLALGGL